MEKVYRKCAPKLNPDPLFNFGKLPNTANVCKKLFGKKDILKEDYQKTFKRLTWFFPSYSVSFHWQNYEKGAFGKKDILKDYQKTVKRLTWFFPSYSVSFHGQNYEKGAWN